MPDSLQQVLTALAISLAFQLAGTAVLLFADKYTDRRSKRLILITTLVVSCLVAAEFAAVLYEENANRCS